MHWSVLTLLVIGIVIGGAATVGTAGDGRGDRDRQVLRRRLPFDAVGGAGAQGERARGEPHRFPCRLPRLPYPEALSRAPLVQGEGRASRTRSARCAASSTPRRSSRRSACAWRGSSGTNTRPTTPGNCRNCHQFTPEALKKQKEFAQPMHQQVLEGKATCIDCHKGVGACRANRMKFCYSGFEILRGRQRWVTLNRTAGRADTKRGPSRSSGRAPELGNAQDGGRFRAGDGPALHPLHLK